MGTSQTVAFCSYQQVAGWSMAIAPKLWIFTTLACPLFFNADLVGVPENWRRQAIVCVDDFLRWQIGQSADENTAVLQSKLEGAARLGAMFEAYKTQLIYFAKRTLQAGLTHWSTGYLPEYYSQIPRGRL